MTEANNHFTELPPQKPPPTTQWAAHRAGCVRTDYHDQANCWINQSGPDASQVAILLAEIARLKERERSLALESAKFSGERGEMSERLSRTQADLVEAVSDPCSAHGRAGRAEYCFGCSAAERVAAALSQERERLAGMFLRTPSVTVTCQLAASIVRYIPTGPPPPLSAGDLEWARAVAARYLADPGPTAPIMPEGFTTETGLLLSDPARRT